MNIRAASAFAGCLVAASTDVHARDPYLYLSERTSQKLFFIYSVVSVVLSLGFRCFLSGLRGVLLRTHPFAFPSLSSTSWTSIAFIRTTPNATFQRMGRRKIPIEYIQDDRSRQVTFQKRKTGLMKKAMELSKLCNCRIGLIVFDGNGKIYDFKTEDMTSLVKEYLTSDVHESNTVDELHRRYNPGEAEPAQQFIIDDESKQDVFFGDVEKTDETVVDVDSNSDGNVDLRNQNEIEARLDKKRKIAAPKPSVTRDEQARRTAAPTTFARSPYPRPRESFTGLDPLFATRFKEEPYSASQQILRLEDIPPFFMRIPRQGTEPMYPMHVPGSDCLGRQDSMYLNNAATSGPVYLSNDDAKKLLDMCESFKAPHLSSTLMTNGMTGPSEMPFLPGHGFPYCDTSPDCSTANLGCQQFPVEAQSTLHDVQQDAMFLQSLLRPVPPAYNFPTSSHNQS